MPNEPFKKLLDRDLSKASLREMIDVASPTLREAVNFGTQAFARCQSSVPSDAEPDVDLPALALYYHILEMTDAVEVLVSQCCLVPAKLQLRSSFEAMLSLEYILENDYRQRSFCWLHQQLRNKLEFYNIVNPKTEIGKAYGVAWAKMMQPNLTDKKIEPAKILPKEMMPTVLSDTEELNKLLNNHTYSSIEAEAKKRSYPDWYRLFNGPQNIRDLSKYLDKQAKFGDTSREVLYIRMYKEWSEVMHGNNFNYFVRLQQGQPAFKRIRAPMVREMSEITQYALLFCNGATRKMLNKFHPGEEDYIAKWYATEMKPRLQQLDLFDEQFSG